ncbi:MAG: hypothetical protein HY340_00990 [Candidatus Kerfeldbacteria bacterium]|nr:hypothetical protein [Candidatus Kerfeldbacteria bacterium]
MNPKQFLLWGGLILVLVAILGFIGVIGPTAEKSIFGDNWWFDNAENWAHLIIGIVGLIAAFAFPMSVQKPLVLILGIIGVVVGIYSIFTQTLGGANLENPADTILHLVVGAWALWASMAKKSAPAMPQQGM